MTFTYTGIRWRCTTCLLHGREFRTIYKRNSSWCNTIQLNLWCLGAGYSWIYISQNLINQVRKWRPLVVHVRNWSQNKTLSASVRVTQREIASGGEHIYEEQQQLSSPPPIHKLKRWWSGAARHSQAQIPHGWTQAVQHYAVAVLQHSSSAIFKLQDNHSSTLFRLLKY